jgi:hypothetical protein
MPGVVGILNVGAGDTRLVLDRDDPASLIRGARIIRDMLRRGYALLAEIEQPDGTKKFQRVMEFREDTFEYVIADFDPIVSASFFEGAPSEDPPEAGLISDEEAEKELNRAKSPIRKPRNGRRTKCLDATKTRAHAVAHTAGG